MTDSYFADLFNHHTVVLTGAGNGIGRDVLLAFHRSGAKIIAHLGRDKNYADGLPDDIIVHTGDFTQPQAQKDFVTFVSQHTDTVDVLINNAGTMFGRFPADTLTEEQYQKIVELNQSAVVRITRGLIPLLTRASGASIVNTVSISALTGGSPGSSIYSASKAFVSTYSKGLARELAPAGIRVNAVSPGVIHTDFHDRYSSAEKLEATRQQIPLQRLGVPGDCTPAFLFLASDTLSSYITGQVIEINGGQR